MSNYIEQATFRAIDEASRPISAINRALRQFEATQAKIGGRADPFAAMMRHVGSAHSAIERLNRDLRAGAIDANRMAAAMERLGRDERRISRGPRGTGATAASVALADERRRLSLIERARWGTARIVTDEERALKANDRTRMAALARARSGTAKLLHEEERARRKEETTAQRAERIARKEQQQGQERAAKMVERDIAQRTRQEVAATRRIEGERIRSHEREIRERDARRPRLHFGPSGGGGGAHGASAHVHLPGLHGAGLGISGLSIPGAMAIQGGANAALHVAGEIKDAVVDYSNQKAMLAVEGLGKDVPGIDRMAGEVSRAVPQVNRGEAISLFREQYAVFGDVEEAKRQTAAAAQRQAILKAATPNAGADTSIQFAKAGEELLGGSLVSKDSRTKENALGMYNRMLDTWMKTFIEEKGQVSANDINQTIKRSKGSLRSKYDINTEAGRRQMQDEVGVQLPILAATLGGSNLGTLLNSTSRAFNGRMTNTAKREFEDMGLLDPTKVISRDKKGNPDRLAYGAFKGSDQSLFRYVMGPLHDALSKKGILDDQKKRDFEIDKLASNQVVAGAIKTILNDYEKLEKGLGNVGRAQDRQQAYKTLNEQDLGTGGRNAKGAVETLGQTYLNPLIQPITSAFTGLADKLGRLSAYGETNTAAKLAAGAGGVALAGGGALASYIYNNPAQAANTTALGVLTGAVTANTAAVRLGALGGAGGLPGKLGRAAGTVGGIAGAVEGGAAVAGAVEGGAAVAGGATLAGTLATVIPGVGTLAGLMYGLKKYHELKPGDFHSARVGHAYGKDVPVPKAPEQFGPFPLPAPGARNRYGAAGHTTPWSWHDLIPSMSWLGPPSRNGEPPHPYSRMGKGDRLLTPATPPQTPLQRATEQAMQPPNPLLHPSPQTSHPISRMGRGDHILVPAGSLPHPTPPANPMMAVPRPSEKPAPVRLAAEDALKLPPVRPTALSALGAAGSPAFDPAKSLTPIGDSITRGATAFTVAADSLPAKGSAFGEAAGSALSGAASSAGSPMASAFAAGVSGITIPVAAPKVSASTGSPPPGT